MKRLSTSAPKLRINCIVNPSGGSVKQSGWTPPSLACDPIGGHPPVPLDSSSTVGVGGRSLSESVRLIHGRFVTRSLHPGASVVPQESASCTIQALRRWRGVEALTQLLAAVDISTPLGCAQYERVVIDCAIVRWRRRAAH